MGDVSFLKTVVTSLRVGPPGKTLYLPLETKAHLARELTALDDARVLASLLDRLGLLAARLLVDEGQPTASEDVLALAMSALPRLHELDAQIAERSEAQLTETQKHARGFGQRFIRPKSTPGGGLPTE